MPPKTDLLWFSNLQDGMQSSKKKNGVRWAAMPEQDSAAFVEEEDCSREFDELYYSSVVTSHKKTDRQASLESVP